MFREKNDGISAFIIRKEERLKKSMINTSIFKTLRKENKLIKTVGIFKMDDKRDFFFSHHFFLLVYWEGFKGHLVQIPLGF